MVSVPHTVPRPPYSPIGSRPHLTRAKQHGISMIIVMVALMVMLAGGVALTRSSDASTLLAGQLAMRRDLKNQGERGIAWAMRELGTGALRGRLTRRADLLTSNYSATQLPSNPQGIPSILLDDAAFTAQNMSAPDISSAAAGVTIRTVVDRLCNGAGPERIQNCTMLSHYCDGVSGGQDSTVGGGEVIKCFTTAYRITVRVTGPRDTQAFFQTIVGL